MLLLLVLLPALAVPPTPTPTLEARRLELAARDDAAALDEARALVFTAIADELLPAWYGTPWSFHGDSDAPGTGAIACGYLVTTVLEDAGFRIERGRLARQASEHIIRTLVPESRIRRFRDRPLDELIAHVSREDGLYLVGLDFHTGFLTVRDRQVRFCHASYLGEAVVLCEDAATSPALASRYRVVGHLLDDAMMRRWLDGAPFPTVGPHP